MGQPTPPTVLFTESFRHYHFGEHVDEVRFSEPVLITAFEILELQTSGLSRVSSPQTYSVEIFIRSGGDVRFKRFCNSFLYSAAAPPVEDVQVAVTDHLVLRGTYDSLTLVLYGNLASNIGQLSGDHELGSPLPDLSPREASYRLEDLPEALHPQRTKSCAPFSPLQYLQLVHIDNENLLVIRKILQLAGLTGRASIDCKSLHKVVKSLLSAAASLPISESESPKFPWVDLWSSLSNQASNDGHEYKKGHTLLLHAKKELQELHDQVVRKSEDKATEELKQDVQSMQEVEEGVQGDVGRETDNSDLILELILNWIQGSVRSSDSLAPKLAPVQSLMGGLAAAQLLCTEAKECYRFALAGGINLLVDVLQDLVGKFSATTLLALGAVECASRYAFGCEALLGWWIPDTPVHSENLELRGASKGYSIILKFLLQPQQERVVKIAAQILHRLRVYELTAAIQSMVEVFVEDPVSVVSPSCEDGSGCNIVGRGTMLIKKLLGLLSIREISNKECLSTRFSHWLALDGEDVGNLLPPISAYVTTTGLTTSITALQDMNPYLLSILQERRLLPMLVALVSAPRLRSSQRPTQKSCAEFVGVIEVLLLTLLSCRSGVLFLANDPEVASALSAAFQRVQELHDKDLSPFRHLIALTNAGFVSRPQDIGGMLQTCLSVISSMDRLLGACKQSEDSLWALWELSTISRLESGRQALLMLTWFPEVMSLLLGAFQSGPESPPVLVFGETWRHAAVHFVAEVLQVVVSGAAGPTFAAWTPLAISIQRALQAYIEDINVSVGSSAGGYEDKDGMYSGLLDWLDSAVIYQKKGASGLLKYASSILASGSGIAQATVGLPAMENMDIDANVADQAVSNEVANVAVPYQGKGAGLGTSPPPLSDTAMVQMTVTFRILALISCYPGVAAVLYGEGAMAVVYSILDQCSTALYKSSSAYAEATTDEDMEDDGTVEDPGDHKRGRLVLGLLLPTALFLLTLLQNLQAAVQNYQDTRLVDVLLSLHHWISSRSASYGSVPPYAWSGITQDLIAVRQVLASVLVCWPVFGWTPPLFQRLLHPDNSRTTSSLTLLPMEPAVTCSVLSLLADVLPRESPQLCNNKSALLDMYRSLALSSTLGIQILSAVSWHNRPPYSEELMQGLVPHLDQIGEVVSHHTSTTCGVLQDMLKLFIVRLACKNMDHAAVIVRPILNQLREYIPNITDSEKEILQVEHTIQLVAGLALHPASKMVLLREGTIEILLNACTSKSQSLTGDTASSTADGGVPAKGWWPWIVRAFTALCDPDISLHPMGPLSRRMKEDCPSFGDCCSIASCLLSLLQVVPVGKEFEVVLEGFEKLSSHRLGRAAIGYISMQQQEQKTSAVEETATDLVNSVVANDGTSVELVEGKPEEHQNSILFDIWERLRTALESDSYSSLVLTSNVRQFALSSIVLTAAGKSTCGVAALRFLFGLGLGPSTDDFLEKKLEPVVKTIAILKQYTVEDDSGRVLSEDLRSLSSVPVPSINEAYTALMAMLRIIKRTKFGNQQIEKAHFSMEGHPASCSTQGSRSPKVILQPRLCLATALFSSTKLDSDLENDTGNSNQDPFLSAKDPETCVLDSRGKIVWECPTILQDRSVIRRSSSKRKSMAMIELSRKRHGMDFSATSTPLADGTSNNGTSLTPNSGRPMPLPAAPVSLLSRRDTFRQRKPNTSRPPSMHVDDYIARERSEVITTGTSPASVQRSISGSGRPPSIHVDEFMARQHERQQLSVPSSGIDDEILVAGRNGSLASVDSGKMSDLGSGTGKTSEVENHMITSPEEKRYDQQREEVCITEGATAAPGNSNDLVGSSPACASAPPTAVGLKADVRSEKAPHLCNTTTDSLQSVKTPEVADMLLLQSKVTLQTTAARNLLGAQQTQTEEMSISSSGVEQKIRGASNTISATSTLGGTHSMSDLGKASVLFDPRMSELQASFRTTVGEQAQEPPASTIQRGSESQAVLQSTSMQSSLLSPLRSTDSAANLKVFTSLGSEQFGPSRLSNVLHLPSESNSTSMLPARESTTPVRGLDPRSLGRDKRQSSSTSVHSSRQKNEQANPPGQNVYDGQAIASARTSPFPVTTHLSPQVGQMSLPTAPREPRLLLSTPASVPASDMNSGPAKGLASSSQASDPRPRPPDMQPQRAATDLPGPVVAPPLPSTPSPWPPMGFAQRRLESSLPSPLVSLLSARLNSPSYTPLVGTGSPWLSGEAVARVGAVPPMPGTPWPGHLPNARYVEETGVAYGTFGRPAQPPGNPPLPAGPGASLHGSMQFSTNMSSPQSTPTLRHSANTSLEKIPGPGISGSRTSPGAGKVSAPLQGYNVIPSLLQSQSAPYVPPPVPAGRPTTTHLPSLAVNIPSHQQQLHLQFQEQNIIKLQQQLQPRPHQLQQHAHSQQTQQYQQQHLLAPLPSSVQVPILVPPIPALGPLHTPAVPVPPQLPPQQRSQQPEPSAVLQKMLASPGAIQALLKDQNKLRELLEQHPKLISLLQERMSSTSS